MRSQFERKRDEATQQIAVPNGIPLISGKCQPPSDIYIYNKIFRICLAWEARRPRRACLGPEVPRAFGCTASGVEPGQLTCRHRTTTNVCEGTVVVCRGLRIYCIYI